MIGILGGYGDIGSESIKMLNNLEIMDIKIGGRQKNMKKIEQNNFLAKFELVKVDIFNRDEVKKFINGCDILVNVTGVISNILIEEVINKKINYLDVNHIILKDAEKIKDFSVIDSVGSLPGLSELLPIYMAKSFDKINNFVSYYGALGVFTYNAAKAYISGVVKEDFPMSVWEDNKISLYKEDNINLNIPTLKNVKKVVPYLNSECINIAKRLNFKNAKWFMAMEGINTLRVLARAKYDYKTNKEQVIKNLTKATEVDCAGKAHYGVFVMEMSGEFSGKRKEKTVWFQCDSPSALTSSAIAITCRAIKDKKMENGVYSLGESNNPEEIVRYIKKLDKYIRFNEFQGSIEQAFCSQEGEI